MNPKTKLTKPEQMAKDLAAHNAKEEVFHLVSKIISWKTKSMDSYFIQNQDKVTAVEWKQYEKHLMEISKTDSAEAIKKKLDLIHSAIQSNQGFE